MITKDDDHHVYKSDSIGRPHQLPIGSQPPESRWSKRAGLRVLHCGPPSSLPPFTRSPDSLLSSSMCESNVQLEEADRFAHRRLDVQRLDILPVFLE
jgi:hypothetical protein